MRDHIALGTQLETRFMWKVFSSSPTQDRKAFDAACEKWEQWEEEQAQRSPSHPYRFSTSRHRPSNSVSTSGTLPLGTEITASHDGHHETESRHPKVLRRTHSNLEVHGMTSVSNGHSHQQYPHQHQQARNPATFSPSRSSRSTLVPSAPRRLSRAMRVFVAWKA